MGKPRVLLIAPVGPIPAGGWGGQLTSTRILLDGGLAEHCVLSIISTTMESVPPPSMVTRALAAMKRVAKAYKAIPRVDTVVVFGADGIGLLEKLVIASAACMAGRRVIVRLSSGSLATSCAQHRFLGGVVRALLTIADVVVVQSESWREVMRQLGACHAKTVVISNGIDLQSWPERIGGQDHHGRVVYIGWLERAKGVLDACEIIKRVRARIPNAHLVLVGRGGAESAVDEWVKTNRAASFVQRVGWLTRDQVRDVLKRADVLLLPSYAEGLPNVVLEAMATGVPVVASDVGALREVVEHAKSGWLARPGDLDTFALHVCCALQDLSTAAAVGRMARVRVVAQFDARTAVAKWLRILAPSKSTALSSAEYR